VVLIITAMVVKCRIARSSYQL